MLAALRFIKNNLVSCLLLVALGLSAAGNAYLFFTRNPTVITDDAIREEVAPIAKLATYEYNFTELMFLDKANNPLGWNNPVTSARYLATIDGTAQIGVDVSKMKIDVSRTEKNEITKIDITLPHSKADNPNLKHETLKKYIEDKGLFDWFRPTTDDYNKLLETAEDNQLHKIEESGLLENSDKRVTSLLTSFITQTYGENVKVTVTFDDALTK